MTHQKWLACKEIERKSFDHRTSGNSIVDITARAHEKLGARLYACALLVFALTILGCGGSNSPVIVNPTGTPASMPTPSAPVAVNTYTGTDSQYPWSITLDDSKSTYSYSGGAADAVQGSGSLQTANGFLKLMDSNGELQGYALEVQSRLALLRPGNSSSPLVVAVPQTNCYVIPYRLRFAYIAMEAAPGSSSYTSTNYASLVLNTDSTGANWQFQGLEGTVVSGPTSFTGACSTSGSKAPLSINTPSLLNLENNGSSLFPYVSGQTDTIDTNLAIGPSGILVSYQSDSSLPSHVSAGSAGFAQATATLSTSSITAGSYLGFMTLAAQDDQGNGVNLDPQSTSPVSFGPTTGSGTTLTGGIFPNDNITSAPNTDIVITLGSQSSTINGLYTSASITMSDPNQNCLTALALNPKLNLITGLDAQGYPICTYPAIAVVGNPEGKFAIFLDSFNYTANSIATQVGAPMQIYLYQQ